MRLENNNIDASLHEYAELILTTCNGFPPESLGYKLINELQGASIRSNSGSKIPIPNYYKINRRMIKIDRAVSELEPADTEIVKIEYRMTPDPHEHVKQSERYTLSVHPKTTYYRKLNKILQFIEIFMQNSRVST